MKIRKNFLLSVIVLAFNIFIVNDISASEREKEFKIIDYPDIMHEDKTDEYVEKIMEDENEKASPLENVLTYTLTYKNYIDLIGGLVSSGFNNYLKWWDYNPGMYCKPVWLGWRSKRFLNGMLQSELNLNVVRGILWLIPGVFGLMQYIKKKEHSIIFKSTAGLIAIKTLNKGEKININNKANIGIFYFIIFLFQGFGSIPLTLHFSNFSISISLDSMIWGVIGFFLDKKDEEEKGGEENEEEQPNEKKDDLKNIENSSSKPN